MGVIGMRATVVALAALEVASALPAKIEFSTLPMHRLNPIRGGSSGPSGAPLSPIAVLGPFSARSNSGDLAGGDSGLALSPSMSTMSQSHIEIGGCLGIGGGSKVPKTIHLLTFMIPTFGIYLANPILSLVDTAMVGQYGDSIELASLGPGCALCDMLLYLCNFLQVATAALVSREISKNDFVAARRSIGCAFSISIGLGVLMTAGLYLFGAQLVGLFAGGGDTAKATLSRSLAYVIIRGLGSAPTIFGMVAQAACIGAKDTKSPVIAVAIVSILNIFFDWLLVGPGKMGVAGAASATTIAQIGGAIYLYCAVARTIKDLESERTYDGGSILVSAADDKKKPAASSLLALPSMSETLGFFAFAGPMFVISLARGVSWNLSTPAAALAGTISLAAHQVILNVFFFFTICGEGVFQTVQAFMPEFQQFQERVKPSGDKDLVKDANERVQKLAKKIIYIAIVIGVAQAGISLIPIYLVPHVFTADLAVQKQVKGIAQSLALSIFPHCATIAIEALLLNSKDVNFLTRFHVFFCVAWAAYLPWQHRHYPGLDNMWRGMMYLQYIRGIVWSLRLLLSGKKLGIHTISVRQKAGLPKKKRPAEKAL